MRAKRSDNLLGQAYSPDESQKLGHQFPQTPSATCDERKSGHWFRFDDGTPLHDVAATAVLYLDEAEAWWRSSANPAE